MSKGSNIALIQNTQIDSTTQETTAEELRTEIEEALNVLNAEFSRVYTQNNNNDSISMLTILRFAANTAKNSQNTEALRLILNSLNTIKIQMGVDSTNIQDNEKQNKITIPNCDDLFGQTVKAKLITILDNLIKSYANQNKCKEDTLLAQRLRQNILSINPQKTDISKMRFIDNNIIPMLCIIRDQQEIRLTEKLMNGINRVIASNNKNSRTQGIHEATNNICQQVTNSITACKNQKEEFLYSLISLFTQNKPISEAVINEHHNSLSTIINNMDSSYAQGRVIYEELQKMPAIQEEGTIKGTIKHMIKSQEEQLIQSRQKQQQDLIEYFQNKTNKIKFQDLPTSEAGQKSLNNLLTKIGISITLRPNSHPQPTPPAERLEATQRGQEL